MRDFFQYIHVDVSEYGARVTSRLQGSSLVNVDEIDDITTDDPDAWIEERVGTELCVHVDDPVEIHIRRRVAA